MKENCLPSLLFDTAWDNQGGLPRGGDARTKTYANSAVRIIQLCLLHSKIKPQLVAVSRLGVKGLEEPHLIEIQCQPHIKF